jgi:hypothetical protein
MVEMLEEILPVQFIEGVNEYAAPTKFRTYITYGTTAAFRYTPKTTYTLKKLSIFFSGKGEQNFTLALCIEHNNSPSDIVLTWGDVVSKSESPMWQEVDFLQPAVIIAEKRYWITVRLDKGEMELPVLKEGKEVPFRYKQAAKWAVESSLKSCHAMLRFYGRYLPIIRAQHA